MTVTVYQGKTAIIVIKDNYTGKLYKGNFWECPAIRAAKQKINEGNYKNVNIQIKKYDNGQSLFKKSN
jgi:hypothetical protein